MMTLVGMGIMLACVFGGLQTTGCFCNRTLSRRKH